MGLQRKPGQPVQREWVMFCAQQQQQQRRRSAQQQQVQRERPQELRLLYQVRQPVPPGGRCRSTDGSSWEDGAVRLKPAVGLALAAAAGSCPGMRPLGASRCSTRPAAVAAAVEAQVLPHLAGCISGGPGEMRAAFVLVGQGCAGRMGCWAAAGILHHHHIYHHPM